MSTYLIANFGGPRSCEEIEPFLIALLNDRAVIRTPLPSFLHRLLFTYIAKKRAVKVAHDYALIGGKSPIFDDTEALAVILRSRLQAPVFTFHRYLPATHAETLDKLRTVETCTILPLFPQFSTATTGSIQHFLGNRFHWIPSFATHPAYIRVMQNTIRDFLSEKNLPQEETLLFFSAHGIPKKFVLTGDPYETECNASYNAIRKAFPQAEHLLAYQSKFGRGEWLRPYTSELSANAAPWAKGRKNIVFIPLSFPSDHVETLFEVEYQYLPPLRAQGYNALRCPALNLRPDWIDALVEVLRDSLLRQL